MDWRNQSRKEDAMRSAADYRLQCEVMDGVEG